VDTVLEIIKITATRLESEGIEYMLTGSMAMALYTQPRMTRDIDIVIKIQPEDAKKIARLFEDDFYVDEESVKKAAVKKGMFNIIHNEAIVKVDFMVRKDTGYRIEEFKRRQKFKIDNTGVYAVSPEDLILSKLLWIRESGSELQRRDVKLLLDTCVLEDEYLEKWSVKLGVAELLREIKDDG